MSLVLRSDGYAQSWGTEGTEKYSKQEELGLRVGRSLAGLGG